MSMLWILHDVLVLLVLALALAVLVRMRTLQKEINHARAMADFDHNARISADDAFLSEQKSHGRVIGSHGARLIEIERLLGPQLAEAKKRERAEALRLAVDKATLEWRRHVGFEDEP